MMDAVVQFLRNAMCCCKDLHLFGDTFLHESKHTALLYDFPEPMNKTTPLELLICVTQLYASVSTTRSGYRLIMGSGYGKLRRVNRLIKLHSKSATLSDRIVHERLVEERQAALRSIFIGINVFCIGCSFFWLFANSLHVTETDWIGGVPALIHALTVMEVCLVPLLYFMLEDGFGQLAKSKRMKELVLVLRRGGGVPEEALNAEAYSWIVADGYPNGWNPFWVHEFDALLDALPDEISETKKLNEEITMLNTTLEAITRKGKGTNKEQESALSLALEKTAARLEEEVPVLRIEGYREFCYFVLNFIAFYGYLLGVVVFYYDKEDFQPTYVRELKLGMTNADADWHGNFAGDLMWTIEPIVILASPMLMGWMKPKIIKVKTD
jgi:hypothetical protein